MKNSRLTIMLLLIVAVFVLGVILRELRLVLLPFTIALLLSNIFSPVVGWLRTRRVPNLVSLFVVALSCSLFLFLLSMIVYSSLEAFLSELPKYQVRLARMIVLGREQVVEWAAQVGITDVPQFDPREVLQLGALATAVSTGIGSFIGFVSYTFLVILFLLFMLAEGGALTAKVERAFPNEQAARIAAMLGNVNRKVRRYLITKAAISLGTGVFTTLILSAIGVDFALLFGFLAFLLNFIPNVGSIVATLLPFFLSLLQFDTLTQPVLVLTLLGGVQVMMGNIIEPRLMAFSLNLSALVVLISLIFWGWLWGVWGMILAVPITATLKILFENVHALYPLAILMSGGEDETVSETPEPILAESPGDGVAIRHEPDMPAGV